MRRIRNRIENRGKKKQCDKSTLASSATNFDIGHDIENLSFRKVFRDATAIFAGMLGLSYVLGFLIINLDLSQYNYTTFEVIRGKYLSAGLLLLAVTSILAIPSAVGLRGFFDNLVVKRVGLNSALRQLFSRFIIGGILSTVLLFLLEDIPTSSAVWNGNLIVFALVTFMILVWYSRLYSRYLFRTESAHAFGRTMLSLFLFPYALLILRFYTFTLYPVLPPSVGGGERIFAQIVLDRTLGESLLKFQRNEGNYSAISAVILFEDDHSILVGYFDRFRKQAGAILNTQRLNKADIKVISYSGSDVIRFERKEVTPTSNDTNDANAVKPKPKK